jgi:hypothetical protein
MASFSNLRILAKRAAVDFAAPTRPCLLMFGFAYVLGLALLAARCFGAGVPRSAAITAWALCGFLLLVTLVLAAVGLPLLPIGRGARRALFLFVLGVFTFPYSWVGFTPWYLRNEPLFGAMWGNDFSLYTPNLEFFPQAILGGDRFPHERLYWLCVLLVASVVLVMGRHRASSAGAKRMWSWCGVFLGLIILETYLQNGLLSPYTTNYYFTRATSPSPWYHLYMFSNGTGAVNGDAGVFQGSASYLTGAPNPSSMLIRRIFPTYIAVQFGALLNPWYVWLTLNIFGWFVAASCMYAFWRKFVSDRIAIASGFMTAAGSGFVLFVATPSFYLWGFAMVAFVAYLGVRLMDENKRQFGDYALVSAGLSIALLTYDLYLLIPLLLVIAHVTGQRLLPIVVASCVSVGYFIAYLELFTRVLGQPVDPANSGQLGDAFSAIYENLRIQNSEWWYASIVDISGEFVMRLEAAFLFPVATLALIGLFARTSRPLRAICGTIVGGVYLQYAILALGNSQLADLPRLYFFAYPAIFVLAALGLKVVSQPLAKAPRARWMVYGLFVALLVINANVNVLGFPTRYTEVQFGVPALPLPW